MKFVSNASVMSSSNNPPLDENEDGNEVQGGDSNESQSADTQVGNLQISHLRKFVC